MPTIDSAVQWILDKMRRELAGARKVEEYPPPQLGKDMTVIAYSPSGFLVPGRPAQARTDFHNVFIQLNIPLKNIDRDYARLIPYVEKMADVICADLTWGGNVEVIAPQDGGNIEYTLGPDTWGGENIVRLRFVVPVKIVRL